MGAKSGARPGCGYNQPGLGAGSVLPRQMSVIESEQLYTFRNVILDPVAVPPFLRVNLDAIELHAEVNMVAGSHARHATCAHYLPSLHHVAFVYGNLAEMSIDGLQPIAVVNHNTVAVNP